MRDDNLGRFSSFFKFSGVHVGLSSCDITKSWCIIPSQLMIITPINEKIVCDISSAKEADLAELLKRFEEWGYIENSKMTSPFKTIEELKSAISTSLQNSL